MFPHLFHRQSTAKKVDEVAINETLRTLIDARFDRLEEKVRAVEREWSDVYDKIMLLYDRTRKRIAASKKAAGDDQPDTPPPASTPVVQSRDDLLRLYDAQRRLDNGRSS